MTNTTGKYKHLLADIFHPPHLLHHGVCVWRRVGAEHVVMTFEHSGHAPYVLFGPYHVSDWSNEWKCGARCTQVDDIFTRQQFINNITIEEKNSRLHTYIKIYRKRCAIASMLDESQCHYHDRTSISVLHVHV